MPLRWRKEDPKARGLSAAVRILCALPRTLAWRAAAQLFGGMSGHHEDLY